MMNARFRNIIWDVDGTLFDTYPAIARAFQSALNALGEESSLDWIEGLARISLRHCVETLADRFHLKEDKIGQAFEEHYDTIRPEAQHPFPGVIAVCKYICNLGGKNVIVTHRERAGTKGLLAGHHMTHYFAGCITRDDDYPRKPHPAAFDAILKTHKLPLAETLTIGDRDIDILAGKAAGISTCLFGLEARRGMADLTIHSFNELYFYLATSI